MCHIGFDPSFLGKLITSKAIMSYANRTLGSIPFSYLIGAPLQAAIEAQALAAKSTIDFIRTVGFSRSDANDPFFDHGSSQAPQVPDMGDARMITFKYSVTNVDGGTEEVNLTVPILTIVPIPYIRIEEMTIDFTAKISEEMKAVQSNKSDTSFKSNYSLGYRSWWSPAQHSFRASYSRNHSSAASRSSRLQTEHTLNIHVRAVQDDVPGGLARVLDILESSIKESGNRQSGGSGGGGGA